jgi:hypothetical protein
MLDVKDTPAELGITMELGHLLQFLDTDHEQLGTSLTLFAGIDGLRRDAARRHRPRFMFLPDETAGEGIFTPQAAKVKPNSPRFRT